MEDINSLKSHYPLHFAIIKNDIDSLKSELESRADLKNIINVQDIHGRTPLMLATMLGNIECAELLLEHGSDANTQNKGMWCLSHEATLLKNADFLKKVLTLRDYQRALKTAHILQELNKNFKDIADFYVEMTWEFTSWLPFVKNMCPSDTYKIYKHGSNIRIDANILEIPSNNRTDGNNNGTPNQSFIFRFATDELAEIIFIDRNERVAYVQNLELISELCMEEFVPSEGMVIQKMKTPITTTYVDVDNVGFERSQKSSLLSWIGSNDKEEEIDGYTCRVFTASNVELITKTCFDHLTAAEKEEALKEDTNKALSILLNLFEKKRVDISNHTNRTELNDELDVVDYLTKPPEAGKNNIGKPREEHIRTNSFNASLWLSESFPLNLREQIFPIIDLMAVRNAKFLRLKRFIQLQMPSGFPIRIKIPIFHLINAQVTFRNVNEPNEEAMDVSNSEENDFPIFKLKQSLFEIPEGFERHEMTGSLLFNRMDDVERGHTGQDMRFNTVDVEDGGEYVYLLERFIGDQTPQTSTYEQQLQLAIQESLTATQSGVSPRIEQSDGQQTVSTSDGDAEFQKALELSKLEEERHRKEMEEEEEQLKAALERSMMDQ